MKILWLCNIMLPKISNSLNLPVNPTGGWLTGLSNDLLEIKGIELTICFPWNEKINGNIDSLNYYSFDKKHYNEGDFVEIINNVKPDVINIFGTEFKHTLTMLNAAEITGVLKQTVVTMQGLVSLISKHYYSNLPACIVHSWTIRDILRFDNIYFAKRSFAKRGKNETLALKKAVHVMGRTDWDKACSKQINPKCIYHHCNETLRDSFYKDEWNYDNCEKHSLFISQCSYPIKGMHLMLEAMKEIVKEYPDAHLYTTGLDPLNLTLKQKLIQNSYNRYLGKLIKKYKLTNNVSFLGILNEAQMKQRYLSSNVFVSCSSIENSPNSVGEAMLLGLPVVSSDVGGVKNMMIHNEDGVIYPFDEPYMISYYVKQIFSDLEKAEKFSKNARIHARATHNRQKNVSTVLSIYKEIANQ